MRYFSPVVKPCSVRAFIFAVALALAAPLDAASAQSAPAPTPSADTAGAVMVPGFWDPKRRPERPDVTRLPVQIRFVTTEDYPPFSFRGEDGRPTGFNVDIARAICTELAIRCTLEILPFEQLVEALDSGKADAAIAGIAISAASRERTDFSDRYFRSPARFVARRGDPAQKVTPDALASKSVGVVADTAHEAYLRDFFNKIAIRRFPDAEAARAALQKGDIDLLFGDGVQLALWLNGTASAGCCVFVGGPFTESLYFGEGMGIAVKRGNDALRQSLNYALAQLWEEGVYTDLYLRWFPISVY
ncbi:amino acid ABC transporter substrate-binding protein, PAAT family (TC 3.A.1.3.-) [Ancylobacter rudongensis]|uniref:Amino acid ABC transporter substrate-binding protein, PAAT family (TC 3.A.1.3.-) n=2 Tax=Ancylobacter rudongensis TaxID=177413 RepID=A0A1G4TA29_9HYPH|nr:amino acid ABC transporter substrate-binding protein, PAAT family (TC 3.A.1.3.-) [Ancylobacter rudongensis]